MVAHLRGRGASHSSGHCDPPRQAEVKLKSGHVSVGEGENLNLARLVISQSGFSDCNDVPSIQAVTDPQSPDMPRGEANEGTSVSGSDDHTDERDLSRIDRAFDCGRFSQVICFVLSGLHMPVLNTHQINLYQPEDREPVTAVTTGAWQHKEVVAARAGGRRLSPKFHPHPCWLSPACLVSGYSRIDSCLAYLSLAL